MRTFAANTGFLFKDLPFLERFQAAKEAGFHALEFHDEVQGEDPMAVKQALANVGLPVLGLNVRMGKTAGCAGLSGEQAQARADIDAAAEAVRITGARALHVMAGKGTLDASAFAENLRYALECCDRTILLEPISQKGLPGYALNTIDQALEIIESVGSTRVKIMFDLFHVLNEEDDAVAAYERCANHVGHIQIASFPARTEPDDMLHRLQGIERIGYNGSYGAEYKPSVEDFAWLKTLEAEPPVIDEDDEDD